METLTIIQLSPEQLEAIIDRAVVRQTEHIIQLLTGGNVAANRMIGIKQAAQVLGISTSGIYHNLDKIPHSKKHGRLYFIEQDLLNYLRSGPPHIPKAKQARQP